MNKKKHLRPTAFNKTNHAPCFSILYSALYKTNHAPCFSILYSALYETRTITNTDSSSLAITNSFLFVLYVSCTVCLYREFDGCHGLNGGH